MFDKMVFDPSLLRDTVFSGLEGLLLFYSTKEQIFAGIHLGSLLLTEEYLERGASDIYSSLTLTLEFVQLEQESFLTNINASGKF